MNEAERRISDRIPVRIPAGIYFKDKKGGVVDGEILNLSLGGAYIRADVPVEVGREVLIEVRFTEASFVPATITQNNVDLTTASIVRWQQSGGEPPKTVTGFGVQFKNLSPESDGFLMKIIQHFSELARAGVKFDDPEV